ncbi:hypothetical protein BGZ94_000022 [Podila epigama]|nr:hypothetical protein BGZ94_000022 [Podila epigama]
MTNHQPDPQQFSMVPLDKDTNTVGVEYQDDSTSTSPVNQYDSTTTKGDNDNYRSNNTSRRGRPTLRESFPQFFVLPHLLSKYAWLLFAATSLVMIAYTWLYLGSLWSPLTRVKNVEIILYNADKGFDYSTTPPQLLPLFQGITRNSSLGSVVQSQIMDPAAPLNHIFNWVDKSQEPGWTYDALVDHVDKGKTWGVLYIPANFSNNLLTFAPSTYMSKSMDALSKGFEQNLLSSPANQTLLQVMYPPLWVQAIHFTETVMHPVLVYGQNFATYVIFIVLYIGSLLAVYSICKYLPNTIETVGVLTFGEESDAVKNRHQIPKFPAFRIVLARHTVSMMFSLLHTIFIWMVPQVLHGTQMSEHFSAGYAFAFIWFTGWSFISILFLLSHLLTVDGFQVPATMLMILMFTSSGGILDWVLMPGFFQVGKAFPFTYAVRGMRSIYFGSLHDKMWINWLVIFGWIAIPGMITMVMARSEIRKRRQNMRRTASVATEV